MPCPDFNVKVMARSAGKSAVASAAYQSCSKLFSEYDQKMKNYNYKWHELFHQEIMLPSNAPLEYADRKTLWNAVEAVEKNWNSQLARRFRMALPREVPSDQYVEMVRRYCQEQFVSRGMICDFAIHDKDDGNPHVHIMLTLRSLDEQGHWCQKCQKEYDLDENGQRIRLSSGEWKSHRVDFNDWNDHANGEIWRHGWETIQNEYLERNNRPERVDLRSYARQGIDKIPMVHMGPAVAAMESKGVQTNIGNLNRDITQHNSLMQSIRNIIRGLKSWVTELADAIAQMKEPTLPEILIQYKGIREAERSTWSSKSQLHGAVADHEKLMKAITFLREHNIDTVEQLIGKLDELEKTADDAKGILKQNDRRYDTIRQIKKSDEILKEHTPIHDAYMKKGFKLTKERYAEAHKDELDAYNRAYRHLKKVCSTTKVDLDDLNKEIKTRQAQDAAAQATLDSVKADLEQLRTVRYYVCKVMPEKIEPRTIKERLAMGTAKADRENAQHAAERTQKKKQNIEH